MEARSLATGGTAETERCTILAERVGGKLEADGCIRLFVFVGHLGRLASAELQAGDESNQSCHLDCPAGALVWWADVFCFLKGL